MLPARFDCHGGHRCPVYDLPPQLVGVRGFVRHSIFERDLRGHVDEIRKQNFGEIAVRGRYLPIQEISRGTFGRVYQALDQATGQIVAIKELLRLDVDARERFKREARILYRQLNNRYIVDLLDLDLEDDPPYIVLEYCEFGCLRTWIDTRQPWRHAAIALSHVLQGLEGIHRLGGFHRDIKPENLLVAAGPNGERIIKVADLGLARLPLPESTTMTQAPGGTFAYMAPEIRAGGAFTACADIYSLGLVLTELLTGQRSPELLAQCQIPTELRDLATAMLAPNPAARPTTTVIADRLRQILAPVSVSVSHRFPQPSEGAASPPSSGGLLGGLLLGGLVVAGLVALARGSGADWDDHVQRYRGADGRFRKR